MQKVSEYEQNAAECRQKAVQMTDPHLKKQLEDMAGVWDRLASERRQGVVENDPEKAQPPVGGKKAVFQIRISGPGNEPNSRRVHEDFYVIAPTPQQAIDEIKRKAGAVEVSVVRELDENEARQFRYLRSAEF